MKIATLFIFLLTFFGQSKAFVTVSPCSPCPSQLSLFGGGNKDGGESKGPGTGMINQLAMFKKAQEVAQMKQKIDKKLAKETFKGIAAHGKVTVECKFSPSKNPMDPQPGNDVAAISFDNEWYDAATPEELSAAVKEAVSDAIKKTNDAMSEKYKILGEQLQGFTQQS